MAPLSTLSSRQSENSGIGRHLMLNQFWMTCGLMAKPVWLPVPTAVWARPLPSISQGAGGT